MLGFIYAIICALLFPLSEAVKKRLTQKTNIYIIFWATTCLALPVYIVGTLVEGIPKIDATFWLALSAAAPLFLISSLILIKALQISPLSLTVPFLSFTPVFLILTSWIMLRELPNVYGVAGIILVAIGAFLLNAEKISHGILAPFKAIKTEKGSLYVLIVAAIWSITSNLDKICLQHSSPFFYLLMINLIISVFLTILLWLKYKNGLRDEINSNFKPFLLLGFNVGFATLFQMLAVQRILVSYTIAIKRAGLVLGGIIFGWLFFKEEKIRYRLIGGLVMVIGILLIILKH